MADEDKYVDIVKARQGRRVRITFPGGFYIEARYMMQVNNGIVPIIQIYSPVEQRYNVEEHEL